MAQILALHGMSGVGKDTIANRLRLNHGYKHLKFAFGLRALVYSLYGLPASKMGDKRFEAIKVNGTTVQSELVRVSPLLLDQDRLVWCKIMANIADIFYADKYVISDLRQPHEKQFVSQAGGLCITVEGPAAREPQPLDRLIELPPISRTRSSDIFAALAPDHGKFKFEPVDIRPMVEVLLSHGFSECQVKQAQQHFTDYLHSYVCQINP